MDSELATRSTGDRLPVWVSGSVVLLVAMLAAMWCVEILDSVALDDRLQRNGIFPRRLSGLDGVLWTPFLHSNYAHLVSNSVPFLVLGGLVMLESRRSFVAVTGIVIVVGGVLTWLFARSAVHIGASGLVFGYLGYLVAAAFFRRSLRSVLLAVVATALYGTMLWGLVPSRGISWEGHLFGLIAGGLAAAALAAKAE